MRTRRTKGSLSFSPKLFQRDAAGAALLPDHNQIQRRRYIFHRATRRFQIAKTRRLLATFDGGIKQVKYDFRLKFEFRAFFANTLFVAPGYGLQLQSADGQTNRDSSSMCRRSALDDTGDVL